MLNSYYKYTPVETAKAILTNQSFRFSSPLLFNDPFDIQNELRAPFNIDNLTQILMQRIKEYVTSKRRLPKSPLGDDNSIVLLKNALNNLRISPSTGLQMFESHMLDIIDETAEKFQHNIKYHNDAWVTGMKQSRVFCVTQSKDNLLMWAHYAQDHKGIVFELEPLSDSDCILSSIKQVKYADKPVSYFSLEEIINWALFQIEPDYSKVLYSNHAWHKSTHWKYEQEWRVIEFSQDFDCSYLDKKFAPKQIKSIIFGCKTEPNELVTIKALAEAINPNIEFYIASKKPNEYGLNFKTL